MSSPSCLIIQPNLLTCIIVYNNTFLVKRNISRFSILKFNYQSVLSKTKLSNVDVLLTDIMTGYMLGWVLNTRIPVNQDINIAKYCICTWIDESRGTIRTKEKYNSKLTRKKEYSLLSKRLLNLYRRASVTESPPSTHYRLFQT